MATYNPAIFTVANIAEAMSIIWTPENSTTEHRWKVETPYVADLIGKQLPLRQIRFYSIMDAELAASQKSSSLGTSAVL
jgi:hypothetical protein